MKPEHKRVIEAMAMKSLQSDGWAAASIIKCALEAAAEEGFVLAKLPEEKEGPEFAPRDRHDFWEAGDVEGWNDCLNAIETITLEESE